MIWKFRLRQELWGAVPLGGGCLPKGTEPHRSPAGGLTGKSMGHPVSSEVMRWNAVGLTATDGVHIPFLLIILSHCPLQWYSLGWWIPAPSCCFPPSFCGVEENGKYICTDNLYSAWKQADSDLFFFPTAISQVLTLHPTTGDRMASPCCDSPMKGTKLDKEALPQRYKSASGLCGGFQGKGRWLLYTTAEDHLQSWGCHPHFPAECSSGDSTSPAGAVSAGNMTSKAGLGITQDVWLLAGPPVPEIMWDEGRWLFLNRVSRKSQALTLSECAKENSKRRREKVWRAAHTVQTTHAGVEPCPDGPPSWWPCMAWVSK